MVEKSEVKVESLLNLEDLLQCPVCYEIPPGQIFQCNEGHHVCGGCKMRLDVCPVCRALFFGTRNYAMEELISNFRKMRRLKLGSKASGSGSSQSSSPAEETNSAEGENNASDEEDDGENNNLFDLEQHIGPPQPCSGLFRCLCCKAGSVARLPSARILNHLRYFHSPDLLEGRSENGEYLQAWQFATVPVKLVTAVRVSDMGIFFLTIDIAPGSVCAWLSMAATPWISHEFSYTISICGNDREAIFSDTVSSVRSCEGTLKKRGHCLMVRDEDALALTAPAAINGKLSIRRTPPDQLSALTPPRTVLRIANRVHNQNSPSDLEPFLQGLQNDVERLSLAFINLGREANALVESEAQIRARIDNIEHTAETTSGVNTRTSDLDQEMPAEPSDPPPARQGLSRNARKRLKQQMRAALDRPIPPVAPSASNRSQASPADTQPRQNILPTQSRQNAPATQPRQNTPATTQPRQNTPSNQSRQNTPTQSRQNTPATQSRQNTAATQPRQNTAATQPRQNTAATQLRHNASVEVRQNDFVHQPRQNGSVTQPRQNTSVTQQRQNTPVTPQRQNGAFVFSVAPVAPPPIVPSSSTESQSQPQPRTGNGNRKRRIRK